MNETIMPPKFKRTVSREDLNSAPNEETENLLDQRSGSDDDDFFLNGPTPQPKPAQFEDEKLKQVRVQISEVTDTMRSNVGKILERGERLEDLRDASERLSSASIDFQAAAARMRRRAWMQHVRTRVVLGAVLTLAVVCLLVPVIIHYS